MLKSSALSKREIVIICFVYNVILNTVPEAGVEGGTECTLALGELPASGTVLRIIL